MADEQQQPDTSVPSAERQAELEAAFKQRNNPLRTYEDIEIKTYGELEWICQQYGWTLEEAFNDYGKLPTAKITAIPSLERQALLETTYELQKDTEAPYKGVAIQTLGELHWLMRQRQWSGKFPVQETQRANLSGIYLFFTNLSGATLDGANLSNANVWSANLSGASLAGANLSNANLSRTNLSRAFLHRANLREADLSSANLDGATLTEASLERTNFDNVSLYAADLRKADCNHTKFGEAKLDTSTQLGDITWGGSNLSVIDWSMISRLGDEHGKGNTPEQIARAYRQLATELRSQGLTDSADQFGYLAQRWQRRAIQQSLRYGGLKSFLSYLGSLFLDTLAGYGYRPWRSFLAYILVILAFATTYFLLGQVSHPLSPVESIVVSMTAFHGRGFFAGTFSPGDPQAIASALEAFSGLIVEVTFIATFTQRFFAR